jgi:helicase
LEGRYGITAYPTDIANWLEEVVRLLECAGEIAGEPGMAAAAEALADPWSER